MRLMPRAVALAIALLSAGAAMADTYPVRPVRVIVPFPPGGVVDVMARLLAQKMSEALGQNFYIDNMGGAGGNIGTRTAALAEKDGYTILITSSSFVVNPTLHTKVPYDPVKDFAPITIAAASPNVLVVNPSEPATNVGELVEDIRKAPGKYSVASAGVGTTPHLSGELFRLSAGLDLVHVPFQGAGPALESTAGGHTLIAFSSLPAAVPLVKSGSLRALATTSVTRLAALPEVPTMAEQGFSGQEAETLIFILAPAGTPPMIVSELGDKLRKILATPEIDSRFDSFGFRVLAMSSDDAATRIRDEIAKWSEVITRAHLRQTVQ
jgi:tripartite-type tricarboxylate transporter receptor subunit TctC